MKTLLSLVFLFALTMAQESALQVLQGNGQFTNNLYKVLAETEGNVFFSPISAHAALSMAYQGAQDTTAEAFKNTLKVPSAKVAAEGYNDIMNRLNAVQNVTLLMANKVFLKDGYTLLPEFKEAVTKKFLSDVQQVDFAKNVAAAKTINDWVEVQTKEKIKDLIAADDLDALTRLVLVNAIYFKGNWASQFSKDRTKTEPFYLNNQDTVDVQMMHIKKKFNYKQDDDLEAQVLEMPYTNSDLSMVIVLPNKRDGIKELEAKLQNVDLTAITNGMWNTEVNVALPRFKMETTIDLKVALTKLGLGEIYDENKANFRGIIPLNPNENLYVSKVIQKAFIEVNEEGAEAAAATGMELMLRSDFSEDFEADHPFIHFIAYRPDAHHRRLTLFEGQYPKNMKPHLLLRIGEDHTETSHESSTIASSTSTLQTTSLHNIILLLVFVKCFFLR